MRPISTGSSRSRLIRTPPFSPSRRRPCRSASRSSTAPAGGSSPRSPATVGGSSRSGRRTATPRCGWRLGQPADGTIVTIDPDRERTELARGWWREAGVPDERITVVSAPALDAFAAADPRARRPVRPGVHRCPQARVRRLSRCPDRWQAGPGLAGPRRQRPVEWPERTVLDRPMATMRTRPPCGRSPSGSCATSASRPRSCRSATACSSRPGTADPADARACPPVRRPAGARRDPRGVAGPAGRRRPSRTPGSGSWRSIRRSARVVTPCGSP